MKSHNSEEIEEYEDLVRKAKDNKLNVVVGREAELKRIIEVLSCESAHHVVLVGEHGVGKKSTVNRLAYAIANKAVPEELQDCALLEVNRCDFDYFNRSFGSNYKRIMFYECFDNAVSSKTDCRGQAITNFSWEDAMSRYNKPNLRVIVELTPEGLHKMKSVFPSYTNYFQVIEIKEQNRQEIFQILKLNISKYTNHHKVDVSDDALEAVIDFSERYLPSEALPGIALKVIDFAAAKLKAADNSYSINELKEKVIHENSTGNFAQASEYSKELAERNKQELTKLINLENGKSINTQVQEDKKKIVDKNMIAEAVSDMANVPVGSLMKTDKEKVLSLKTELKKRVTGQDEAVVDIYNTVLRFKSGIQDDKKPLGSFLFMGPTGVGKTEIAKALAEQLFDDEKSLITIDMSEYQSQDKVNSLIGSARGYVDSEKGGILTEAVKNRPYSIVLFDEFEKAHDSIWNIFLQLLDEGRVTDSQGQTVNFKNTIIIATSNIGAECSSISDIEKRKKAYRSKLLEKVKPEIVNRFDNLIVFNSLNQEAMLKICDKFIARLNERCKKQKSFDISLSDIAKNKIIKEGSNINEGARPIDRYIKNNIETIVAEKMIEYSDSVINHIDIDVVDDDFIAIVS